MDGGVLGRKERQELRERYESLDPFRLKEELERRLKPILRVGDDRQHPAGGSIQ